MFYILSYLLAIVVANLITTWLGPWVSVITAFASIGLGITARDSLHDKWEGSGLAWKMFLLIFLGSAISYLINKDSKMIALASFIAFSISNLVDTFIYSLTSELTKFERVNWSNLISSCVDSILFPLIAFGMPLNWGIVYGQATAKIGGGLFWALIIFRLNYNKN
jgi:hypothetical protein